MPQLHIDKVYRKQDSYQFIVNFQNGYPTKKFEETPCVLLEDKSGNKSIATEINGLIYAGDENDEEIGKTLILARDRKSGKVRLIEAGCISVKPIMKSDVETTMDTSYLELGRKFGSKKHKKYLEQREKLKLNDQSVTEQMQNVTANISIDVNEISTPSKANPDEHYLPYCNRDAKSVQDVYPLDKMLPEELYKKIYSEIDELDLTPHLLATVNSYYKNDCSRELRVLTLYCSTLLTIAAKTTREICNKCYLPCKISSTLNSYVIDNFFGIANGRRTRSTQLKDKALCHALVFLLLISNYKFNVDNLCNELKLPFKQFAIKVKMTGATVSASNGKHFAILKLPLGKIPVKMGKRK